MRRGNLVKPVAFSDNMHSPPPPQQFVLIPKAYSDGVSLRRDGPEIKKEFNSECIYEAGRSFRTAATFIPKLVPKHFVTTLTVAEELTYYESIAFERRTVMQNYSETTNVFLPKEITIKYISTLYFDPDSTIKYYIVGTEMIPARKFVVIQEPKCNGEGDATECSEKSEINGDIQKLLNGKIAETVKIS